jgi:hypothetical protein
MGLTFDDDYVIMAFINERKKTKLTQEYTPKMPIIYIETKRKKNKKTA